MHEVVHFVKSKLKVGLCHDLRINGKTKLSED